MTAMTAGEANRDKGVDAVLAAANAVHRAQAAEALREALDACIDHSIETGEGFTAEDVRERAGNPETHHPNVLSALFSTAVRTGRIRQRGPAIRATRRERNSGLFRRWQAVRPALPQNGDAV